MPLRCVYLHDTHCIFLTPPGNEAVRWGEAARQLDIDLVNLVGNVLLAAGCVAYMGPFTAEFRKQLVGVRALTHLRTG